MLNRFAPAQHDAVLPGAQTKSHQERLIFFSRNICTGKAKSENDLRMYQAARPRLQFRRSTSLARESGRAVQIQTKIKAMRPNVGNADRKAVRSYAMEQVTDAMEQVTDMREALGLGVEQKALNKTSRAAERVPVLSTSSTLCAVSDPLLATMSSG